MKAFTTKDKRSNINIIFVFIFWIIVWQIIYLIIAKDIYLPAPFDVLKCLSKLILEISFWKSILMSMYRVLIGFLLSVILGIAIGILSSANKYIYDLTNPIVSAIKATPVVSFIIITLIWFSSHTVPIVICILMCFPIIWTNVVEGIRNVDYKLLEMAKVYSIKKVLILKNIYLPSIVPYLSAACITSLGLGWRVNVAAEVLSYPKNSIGMHLYSAKVYLDSIELFAWTLVVVMLSILLEKVFSYLIKKINVRKRMLSSFE